MPRLLKCIRSTELNLAGQNYKAHRQTMPGETLYPWAYVDTRDGGREWVPLHDFDAA